MRVLAEYDVHGIGVRMEGRPGRAAALVDRHFREFRAHLTRPPVVHVEADAGSLVATEGRDRIVMAPGARGGTLRPVLAALHAAALGRGLLALEGTAFTFGGGALIACGPSRVTKTHVLLDAVGRGALPVASAWCWLDLDSGRVLGLPQPVRLEPAHRSSRAVRDARLRFVPRARLAAGRAVGWVPAVGPSWVARASVDVEVRALAPPSWSPPEPLRHVLLLVPQDDFARWKVAVRALRSPDGAFQIAGALAAWTASGLHPDPDRLAALEAPLLERLARSVPVQAVPSRRGEVRALLDRVLRPARADG